MTGWRLLRGLICGVASPPEPPNVRNAYPGVPVRPGQGSYRAESAAAKSVEGSLDYQMTRR
jgi:hypothetical protein